MLLSSAGSACAILRCPAISSILIPSVGSGFSRIATMAESTSAPGNPAKAAAADRLILSSFSFIICTSTGTAEGSPISATAWMASTRTAPSPCFAISSRVGSAALSRRCPRTRTTGTIRSACSLATSDTKTSVICLSFSSTATRRAIANTQSSLSWNMLVNSFPRFDGSQSTAPRRAAALIRTGRSCASMLL